MDFTDSLPSESSSHHTTPFLSAKLELVVFLCHVLLLTLLQALPRSPATSEGRAPNEARSERCDTCVAARHFGHYSEATKQSKRCPRPLRRGRKRSTCGREGASFACLNSLTFHATMHCGRRFSETSSSTKCRTSSRRRLKPLSRRSQYCSV